MAKDSELVVLLKLDGTELGKGITRAQQDIGKIGIAFSAVSASAAVAVKFAANFQDSMIKSARAAGATASAFSSLSYAANLSGVNTETLSKSLIKLQNPSDTATRAFRDMGIATKDASGKLKGQDALLAELSNRLSGITDPASKAQAAVRIFGEEGAKMVSMLEGGTKALEAAQKEAAEFGQVVSEQAGKNAEQFNDNLAKLTMGLTGVRNVVSETIIEFVNQSGALEQVQESLKSVISWWRGLSDGTKQTIVYIAAGVAAFGALLVALSAVAAILPAISAGFALMLGPVGLIIGAIGLIAAGIIAYNAANKTALEIARDQEKQANKNADALKGYETALTKLAAKTKLTSTEQADLARIKEDVRKRAQAAGQAIDVQSMSMQQLINKTRELRDLEKVNQYASINKQLVELGKKYNEAEGRIKVFGDSLKNSVMTSDQYSKSITKTIKEMQDYKAEMQSLGVKIQTLNSKEEKAVETAIRFSGANTARMASLDSLNQALAGYSARNAQSLEQEEKSVKEYQKAYTDSINGVRSALAGANLVKAIADMAGSAIKPFGDLTDTIAKGIEYDSQVALRDLDVVSKQAEESYKATREALETSENEKIRALESSYDQQIRLIQDQENRKNGVAQAAANERLLIADDEYQKAKEAAQKAYEEQLLLDQEQYEQKMITLEERALDREQRQLTESIMEEDARKLKEAREKEHEERLAALAKEYADKTKGIDAEAKAVEKANTELSKLEIEALTKAKNEALTLAEQEKNAKLKTLDEQRAVEEKDIEKKRLQTQYNAQVDAFNATKAVKIAETAASGAAAAAQAFVSMTAAMPFGMGQILGGVVAGVILTTTAIRIGQINSQKPIKPAGLLEDGGFIGGSGRHMDGSDYPARVESKEFVIDRGRTQKMFNAIDNGMMGGGVAIRFEAGAIQGDIRDERTIDRIADMLGRKISRQMVMS